MDNPGNVAELPENTESSYGEKLFGAALEDPWLQGDLHVRSLSMGLHREMIRTSRMVEDRCLCSVAPLGGDAGIVLRSVAGNVQLLTR